MSIEGAGAGFDIALRQGSHLLWSVEVKTDAKGVQGLLRELSTLGANGVDLPVSKAWQGSVTKARSLLRHQPVFFSAVSTESDEHFSVAYVLPSTFILTPTAPPVLPMQGSAPWPNAI
jgi:hypothetical protein